MTPSAFPLTPWSSILRGQELDEDTRRETMRRLLERYWQPLYACVRFGWGSEPDEATRRLEEFFYVLLHTDQLRDLDPEKGRFRDFLKARLDDFMTAADADSATRPAASTEAGAAGAAPRETGIADPGLAEPLDRPPGSPGEVFDASWVELLIGRALERFEEEAAKGEDGGAYAVFHRIDVEGDRRPAAEIAAEIGLAADRLGDLLHEARKHFRRVVAQQVQDYTIDDSDAREELRWTIG